MKIKRMIFKLLLVALIVGIVVPAAHSAQHNSYRTVSMQLSTSSVAAAIQPTTNATKDWGTVKLLQTIAISVERMVLSPDGNTLAVQTQTASGDAIVQLWNINMGKVINNFSSFSAQGYDDAIAFSPDGKILAISNYFPSSKMLRIQLWDVQSKQQIRTLESILEPQIPQEPDSSPRRGSTIIFSRDGETLVSVAADNSTIQLWDVEQGIIRHSLTGTGKGMLAVSPDGQILARSSGQTITLWNVETQQRIHTLRGSQRIMDLVFSRDGKTLINTYENMEQGIQRWDVRTGQLIRTTNYGLHWSENPVFSLDGQYLASGSSYMPLRVFDLGTDKPVFETQEFLVAGGAFAISPDGQTLAGITDGPKTKIWRYVANNSRSSRTF
jgi:WD40 repeat protein